MKILLVFAALALPALAADYSLDLLPNTTKIQFTVTDPLHTVRGTFDLKRGRIDFNTETGKASGEVVVDVTSGASGSDSRDSKMQSSVLESKKYPEAIFVPDHVIGSLAVPGDSTVKVHGTFTIHGAPHEMTMDVRASGNGGQMHASMEFEIPYVAWGMKDPSNFILRVGKTVRMTIETSGTLQLR